MSRSASLNSNEPRIDTVDSGPHDFAPHSDAILDVEPLLSESADEAVAPHSILTLLLVVGRAIRERVVRRHAHAHHLHCILLERVSADQQVAHLPIIFQLRGWQPLHGLRAGGELVGLHHAVEEGRVLLPYFVGLIDGGVGVLLAIHI